MGEGITLIVLDAMAELVDSPPDDDVDVVEVDDERDEPEVEDTVEL